MLDSSLVLTVPWPDSAGELGGGPLLGDTAHAATASPGRSRSVLGDKTPGADTAGLVIDALRHPSRGVPNVVQLLVAE
ncbi:hypothetical protein AN480_29080 (plasmid) [Mycobacterium intracellulare subsp. chimaera]|nr:hypothetical protein AN480_29080 [Mycobacterium intracellulare subsp. chimaera]